MVQMLHSFDGGSKSKGLVINCWLLAIICLDLLTGCPVVVNVSALPTPSPPAKKIILKLPFLQKKEGAVIGQDGESIKTASLPQDWNTNMEALLKTKPFTASQPVLNHQVDEEEDEFPVQQDSDTKEGEDGEQRVSGGPFGHSWAAQEDDLIIPIIINSACSIREKEAKQIASSLTHARTVKAIMARMKRLRLRICESVNGRWAFRKEYQSHASLNPAHQVPLYVSKPASRKPPRAKFKSAIEQKVSTIETDVEEEGGVAAESEDEHAHDSDGNEAVDRTKWTAQDQIPLLRFLHKHSCELKKAQVANFAAIHNRKPASVMARLQRLREDVCIRAVRNGHGVWRLPDNLDVFTNPTKADAFLSSQKYRRGDSWKIADDKVLIDHLRAFQCYSSIDDKMKLAVSLRRTLDSVEHRLKVLRQKYCSEGDYGARKFLEAVEDPVEPESKRMEWEAHEELKLHQYLVDRGCSYALYDVKNLADELGRSVYSCDCKLKKMRKNLCVNKSGRWQFKDSGVPLPPLLKKARPNTRHALSNRVEADVEDAELTHPVRNLRHFDIFLWPRILPDIISKPKTKELQHTFKPRLTYEKWTDLDIPALKEYIIQNRCEIAELSETFLDFAKALGRKPRSVSSKLKSIRKTMCVRARVNKTIQWVLVKPNSVAIESLEDGALVEMDEDPVYEDDDVEGVSKAHWSRSAQATLKKIILGSGCRFHSADVRAVMAEFGKTESATRHKMNRLRAEICVLNEHGRWVLPKSYENDAKPVSWKKTNNDLPSRKKARKSSPSLLLSHHSDEGAEIDEDASSSEPTATDSDDDDESVASGQSSDDEESFKSSRHFDGTFIPVEAQLRLVPYLPSQLLPPASHIESRPSVVSKDINNTTMAELPPMENHSDNHVDIVTESPHPPEFSIGETPDVMLIKVQPVGKRHRVDISHGIPLNLPALSSIPNPLTTDSLSKLLQVPTAVARKKRGARVRRLTPVSNLRPLSETALPTPFTTRDALKPATSPNIHTPLKPGTFDLMDEDEFDGLLANHMLTFGADDGEEDMSDSFDDFLMDNDLSFLDDVNF